jgi:hypothetical protein
MDFFRKIVNSKKNRCEIPKCFRKKYYGTVCIKHKCKRKDCSRPKFKDKYYCSRHCCSAHNCILDGKYEFNKVNDAVTRVCHNHLCNYNGYPILKCSNINVTGTVYCGQHLCRYDKCYLPVLHNGHLLCVQHHTEHNNHIPHTKSNKTYSTDINHKKNIVIV